MTEIFQVLGVAIVSFLVMTPICMLFESYEVRRERKKTGEQ